MRSWVDLLVVDGDHPRPELHTDREVVHRLEALVGELQKQAGLPHARVADDDVFEQKRVRHTRRSVRGILCLCLALLLPLPKLQGQRQSESEETLHDETERVTERLESGVGSYSYVTTH